MGYIECTEAGRYFLRTDLGGLPSKVVHTSKFERTENRAKTNFLAGDWAKPLTLIMPWWPLLKGGCPDTGAGVMSYAYANIHGRTGFSMLGSAVRGLRDSAIALFFVAASPFGAPAAAAPPSAPCASSAVGTIVPGGGGSTAGYSLCTNAGWVHFDGPIYTKGDCAHVGTVGPNNDGTYTICTNQGWLDVNRSVCNDFPGVFNCG